MAGDTVTFAINTDELTMERFAVAIRRFVDLLAALNREIGEGANIEWILTDLSYGSAIATAQAKLENEDQRPIADRITDSYVEVGNALRSAEPIPFSQRVEQRALRIRDLLDSDIETITFETFATEVVIERQPPSRPLPEEAWGYAYGAVTGRVQALSNRGSLRFTLYDRLSDRAVSCYMEPGHEDQMRDIWGRMATVEGWVRRDRKTGRPLTARKIRSISPLGEPERGAYRAARGAVPRAPNEIRAEEAIRRLRDAE